MLIEKSGGREMFFSIEVSAAHVVTKRKENEQKKNMGNIFKCFILPLASKIGIFLFFPAYCARFGVAIIMTRPDYGFIGKNCNLAGK